MSWRAHQITRAIRRYDRELYAREGYAGRIDIFRKTFVLQPFELDDGLIIYKVVEEPYRVFCLTDTWNAYGRPVDWGIEPILQKLKKSDLWHRDIGAEINVQNEKVDESQKRNFHNETEAYLKDARSAMAKAWGDVNTSTLNKKADRRYRDERKIKL